MLNSKSATYKTSFINNRRYLGNKYKLLPFIKSVVDSECEDIESVADIFAGTGAVSSAFTDKTIITNDLMYSNYICNYAWFGDEDYNPHTIIDYVVYYNSLSNCADNYMTENFADTYFSYEDCAKIGFIREDIENHYLNGDINERERAILITSLLYAMDKIANTCGHYDAYRQGAEFEKSLELYVPLEAVVGDIDIVLPEELVGKNDIEYDIFQSIFKGSKNNASISQTYYNFFRALKSFRDNKTEKTYAELIKCFDEENVASLNKAFGYGKSIFSIGNRGNRYNIEKFMEKNSNHPLLVTDDYIGEFYVAYAKSKWIDGVREYSDTTTRLLSATGIFKFKNLPELSYKEILSLIFDSEQLRLCIFGEMTEDEYAQYEATENCYYGKSVSISDIFNYSHTDALEITEKIKNLEDTNI